MKTLWHELMRKWHVWRQNVAVMELDLAKIKVVNCRSAVHFRTRKLAELRHGNYVDEGRDE